MKNFQTAGLTVRKRLRPVRLTAVNPKTQILLLDVDGVLIELPDFYCSRFESGPVREFFAGPFQSASTGQSDLLDHLPDFMDQIGREGTPQDFYREWLDYENRPHTPMLDAVRELRTLGWRIYLATNQEAHRTAHLLRESGLEELVDGHFASYAVGHRKPSAAYYAAVTEQLGKPPQDVIFWDDSAENVTAARAAGWQARLFTDVASFRQAMELDGTAQL